MSSRSNKAVQAAGREFTARQAVAQQLVATRAQLEEAERVLQLIPPCPVHGWRCIPHALEWVRLHLPQSQAKPVEVPFIHRPAVEDDGDY